MCTYLALFGTDLEIDYRLRSLKNTKQKHISAYTRFIERKIGARSQQT